MFVAYIVNRSTCFDFVECTCKHATPPPASYPCAALRLLWCSFMWLSKHSFWRINRNVQWRAERQLLTLIPTLTHVMCGASPHSHSHPTSLHFPLTYAERMLLLLLLLLAVGRVAQKFSSWRWHFQCLPLELFDYVNWLWKTCSRSNSLGLEIVAKKNMAGEEVGGVAKAIFGCCHKSRKLGQVNAVASFSTTSLFYVFRLRFYLFFFIFIVATQPVFEQRN